MLFKDHKEYFLNKEPSNHINAIKSLLMTINASSKIHALIVEGPAGWGKTTAVDEAINSAKMNGVHLGAYSTPLNLYNFLYDHADKFVVIDDCAGLFNDQKSMAILKAATWAQGKSRKIRWGSTSSKAIVPEYDFSGKLVIICNSFPKTPDAKAVQSRSFPFKMDVTVSKAKTLIKNASIDKTWYPDSRISNEVSEFLCCKINTRSLNQISYRTMQMGYELAQFNPDGWKDLMSQLIGNVQEDPKDLVIRLNKQNLKVKDQIQIFEESTGFKRRTFFKYRKELKLSK